MNPLRRYLQFCPGKSQAQWSLVCSTPLLFISQSQEMPGSHSFLSPLGSPGGAMGRAAGRGRAGPVPGPLLTRTPVFLDSEQAQQKCMSVSRNFKQDFNSKENPELSLEEAGRRWHGQLAPPLCSSLQCLLLPSGPQVSGPSSPTPAARP